MNGSRVTARDTAIDALRGVARRRRSPIGLIAGRVVSDDLTVTGEFHHGSRSNLAMMIRNEGSGDTWMVRGTSPETP